MEILKIAYKSGCTPAEITGYTPANRAAAMAVFKSSCLIKYECVCWIMGRALGWAAAIFAATGWMLMLRLMMFRRRLLMMMMMMMMILLPQIANAQMAASSMDRDTLGTGDLFTYRVEITGIDSFREVIYPDSASFGPDFVMRGKQVQAGRLRHELVYTLQFFGIDTDAVPELYAGLVANSDTLYLIIPQTPFIYQSRVDADDEEIRPLKPIFPFFLSIWPYILAGLILALAAAYLLYRYRDRLFSKKEPVEITEPVTEPFRNPLDELRTELNRIENKYPDPSLEAKSFYSELGDAFRAYFENTWQYPALESTTSELVAFLSSEKADMQVVDLLSHLLEEADLVKFAKYKPNESDGKDVMRGGYILAERIAITDRNRIAMLLEKHKEQFAKESQ